MTPPVYVITGVQAAGKSSLAEALAARLPRSAHVHGDVFRRWIVGGRVDPAPGADDEAWRQLALRHQMTADAARSYRDAGFTVVVQDVILGERLPVMVDAVGEPVHVVVLDGPGACAARRPGGSGRAASPRNHSTPPRRGSPSSGPCGTRAPAVSSASCARRTSERARVRPGRSPGDRGATWSTGPPVRRGSPSSLP